MDLTYTYIGRKGLNCLLRAQDRQQPRVLVDAVLSVLLSVITLLRAVIECILSSSGL
jgi:hypothetical protein